MADKPNSERDRPNLIIRLPRPELDGIRKVADRRDVTVTDYMRDMIRRALKREGISV